MIWLGGLIAAVAFAAIIKGFELRAVLLLSGLLMSILSAQPGTFFAAFSAAMVNGDLVPVICCAAGFSHIMKRSGCEKSFLELSALPPGKIRTVLIPATIIGTFFVNIIVPSATGCAVLMGVLLIPVLKKNGVHPAVAAAAVLAGTWGSVLNPGQIHNPFVARLAGVSEYAVVAGHTPAVLAGLVIVAACITVAAVWKKEDGSQLSEPAADNKGEKQGVDVIKALMPLIPLLLVIIGNGLFKVLPWEITVPQAMIFGAILSFGATLQPPSKLMHKFFSGIGRAYGGIIATIITAAVFAKGLEAIGFTGELINIVRHAEHYAGLTAALGPFLVAVLTGTGDGASLAFNTVITPYADQFGYDIARIGSTAFIAGALGRAVSPAASVVIVCAALSEVSLVEVLKRTIVGMLTAVGLISLMLLY